MAWGSQSMVGWVQGSSIMVEWCGLMKESCSPLSSQEAEWGAREGDAVSKGISQWHTSGHTPPPNSRFSYVLVNKISALLSTALPRPSNLPKAPPLNIDFWGGHSRCKPWHPCCVQYVLCMSVPPSCLCSVCWGESLERALAGHGCWAPLPQGSQNAHLLTPAAAHMLLFAMWACREGDWNLYFGLISVQSHWQVLCKPLCHLSLSNTGVTVSLWQAVPELWEVPLAVELFWGAPLCRFLRDIMFQHCEILKFNPQLDWCLSLPESVTCS